MFVAKSPFEKENPQLFPRPDKFEEVEYWVECRRETDGSHAYVATDWWPTEKAVQKYNEEHRGR